MKWIKLWLINLLRHDIDNAVNTAIDNYFSDPFNVVKAQALAISTKKATPLGLARRGVKGKIGFSFSAYDSNGVKTTCAPMFNNVSELYLFIKTPDLIKDYVTDYTYFTGFTLDFKTGVKGQDKIFERILDCRYDEKITRETLYEAFDHIKTHIEKYPELLI